jgi:hypothetical protein
MSTRDDFDDTVRRRLRASAPQEAPIHLMDTIIDRVAATPQRRGPFAWLGSGGLRVVAVAAVVLAAIVVGMQFGNLVNRPVGADPSPDASASEAPSVEASSSADPSASATDDPPPSSSATPEPSTGAADDELVLRMEVLGGTSFGPDLMTEFTLMGDGTVVWLRLPSPAERPTLVTRRLTDRGLAELRDHIFGGGLLEESATHDLEQRPDAPDPPGRGVSVYRYTAGAGDTPVVVTSVAWMGDEDEAAYYVPAPERKALDELALDLMDPESVVSDEGWAAPLEPYDATDYLLLFHPSPDVTPFTGIDASEVDWPFAERLDAFGEAAGTMAPGQLGRCGVISAGDAARILEGLERVAPTDPTAFNAATLDWAEGNGVVNVFLYSRMPDGYPACAEVP